jgi:hypothetical protein
MRSAAKQGSLKRRVKLKGVKRDVEHMPVKVKKKPGGGYEFTVGVMHPKPGSHRGEKRRSMAARLWRLEEERVADERADRERKLAALYAHSGG